MSNGFFKELESMLDNEWISLKDFCALLAGFCPLEPFKGDWGSPDERRRYKRISNGKEVKLSKADFTEMQRYAEKWSKSDFDITANSRYPNIMGGNDTEISTRFAFKVALGFRPLDERVCALYEAALDQGLILPESSLPVAELFDNFDRPPELSQSPLQDNLIQITKHKPDTTAGDLFKEWERVKPYYIDEIHPHKDGYQMYKYDFTTHQNKHNTGAIYGDLQSALNRAKDKNKKS